MNICVSGNGIVPVRESFKCPRGALGTMNWEQKEDIERCKVVTDL